MEGAVPLYHGSAHPDKTPPAKNTTIRLVPVATRTCGDDLLVAAPGPYRDPVRLSGTGPLLWRLLADGVSIGEVAERAAAAAGLPVGDVEADVAAFVASLLDLGLVQPA